MATQKSSETFSLIPRRKLLALYTCLLRCRMMTEIAGRIARRHASGHEAPAVAAVIDLKPGDTVAAAAHDFLPGFVNGVSPRAIVTALLATPSHSRTSFAATLKASLAAARSHAQRKNRHIAAVFAKDAAVASAAWRRAMRIAGAERLPMLFVSQPGAASAPAKAAAHLIHGFPVITVDGDDVVALYRAVSESLAHARRGNGPTLIECIPWPLDAARNGAHPANDAIFNMERYLAQMQIPFERWKRQAVEEFGRSLRTPGAPARTGAKAARKKRAAL